MRIDVHIDELILEGLPGGQRQAVAEAIQRALDALVEKGAPTADFRGAKLASLTQTVQPGSQPEAIGQQVAQAIWSGIVTLPQATGPSANHGSKRSGL